MYLSFKSFCKISQRDETIAASSWWRVNHNSEHLRSDKIKTARTKFNLSKFINKQ